MALLSLLILSASIIVIYFGARGLVEGASGFAVHFRVPPLIIGLTIVAFGTSVPELMLGIVSGLEGVNSLSVGNVVGSNISNATYIIGSCAILVPIVVRFNEIKREAMFMLLALGTVTIFAADGGINAIEGGIMVLLFIAYSVWLVRSLYCCRPTKSVQNEFDSAQPKEVTLSKNLFFLLFGTAILILGTDFAVGSASEVASGLGMSEFLIGVTIVTVGTTIPEFAASLIAARRKRPDIAVGNVIGTLIFNSTLVLGSGALIRPLAITSGQLWLGFLPMLFFGILLSGIACRRDIVWKRTGVILVVLYVLYLGVIISFT
jgi:cation:H+ antiporter